MAGKSFDPGTWPSQADGHSRVRDGQPRLKPQNGQPDILLRICASEQRQCALTKVVKSRGKPDTCRPKHSRPKLHHGPWESGAVRPSERRVTKPLVKPARARANGSEENEERKMKGKRTDKWPNHRSPLPPPVQPDLEGQGREEMSATALLGWGPRPGWFYRSRLGATAARRPWSPPASKIATFRRQLRRGGGASALSSMNGARKVVVPHPPAKVATDRGQGRSASRATEAAAPKVPTIRLLGFQRPPAALPPARPPVPRKTWDKGQSLRQDLGPGLPCARWAWPSHRRLDRLVSPIVFCLPQPRPAGPTNLAGKPRGMRSR